jgi:hypothetical protein
MPKDYRPPSPRTIANLLYLVVLVIAILLAYVAVRSLFG